MKRTALTLILAGWAGLACSGKSASEPSKMVSAAEYQAQKEAEGLFASRCTPCHGPNGRGDGPASGSLNPHPRNFHDGAWHQSVTDEHIDQIIQYGGSAVGKSAAMPANPDLTGKPEVVAALRKKIRGFANQ